MKKLLLIMNPCAGQRRANRHLADIIALFNRKGYLVTAAMTAARGDGIRLVRELGAGMDLIVCIGGDGTFNETITGLLSAGLDIPLGYIPAGSTNDFANSLKLPTDIRKAAEAIAEGKPVAYDVGRFAHRNFSYVASFGLFTKTSYSTPQPLKNALGHIAYLLAGISELGQIPSYHVKFETDNGTVEGDYLFGAISNSTSVGGILTLDPNVVDMADGKFELLLARKPKNAAELAECLHCLTVQKYNCAMITFLTCSKLHITADPAMVWTLDGEREDGHASIEVENLHLAIRLMKKES